MYELSYHPKSLSAYIQNNPETQIPGIRGTNEPTIIGKNKKDAENTCYKNGKGCFIPQKQIWGSMREAAKMVKLRKTTMGKLFKAICAPIEPFEIIMCRKGKPIKTYDSVYNEPIFKPNGEMVFNPRAMFNDWEADIKVTILDDSIPEEKIDEILMIAGLYKGIGSRRPMYGRFMFEKVH